MDSKTQDGRDVPRQEEHAPPLRGALVEAPPGYPDFHGFDEDGSAVFGRPLTADERRALCREFGPSKPGRDVFARARRQHAERSARQAHSAAQARRTARMVRPSSQRARARQARPRAVRAPRSSRSGSSGGDSASGSTGGSADGAPGSPDAGLAPAPVGRTLHGVVLA